MSRKKDLSSKYLIRAFNLVWITTETKKKREEERGWFQNIKFHQPGHFFMKSFFKIKFEKNADYHWR